MAKTTKKTKEVASEKKGKTHPLVIGARITEKSAIWADKGVYTFNVMPSANKTEIKKAIKSLYNVTPVKISMTKVSSKVVMRGQVKGIKSGGKKVVVHLKKGDKITFA